MTLTRIHLLLGVFVSASSATAQTLFPAGSESKLTGLESALQSVGAPSVLYNPANLRIARDEAHSEPYVELGLIRVHLTYEHPEFDPVRVTVTSPIATLGYTARLPYDLTAGVVVFPKKSGKTEIPGLPREVAGSVVPLEVETEDRVVDIGAGVGWRAHETLSLGLSAVHTVETHELSANMVDDPDPLIEMSYKNQFTRPVLGGRYTPSSTVAIGMAVKPAHERAYKGSQELTTDDEPTSPRVKNYDPLTVTLGVEAGWNHAKGALEVSRQAWLKGEGVVRSGLGADDPNADLKDVTEWSLTARYDLPQNVALGAGYASLPSPWGDGYDDGILESHEYGADFGQLNAVDRTVYSLGGVWQGETLDVSATIMRIQGERTVEGTGDNPGYYTLGVTSVSGAVRATF